ncbi:MAG: hypothetical protein QXQ76_03985 [Candidatus Bathyarchaeia archaeon]
MIEERASFASLGRAERRINLLDRAHRMNEAAMEANIMEADVVNSPIKASGPGPIGPAAP